MNWMQKTFQSIPPTYTGIGHGYRWDENENKYVELWQSKDTDPVLLWYYESGKIVEEKRMYQNHAHWSDTDDARGRIETGTGRGSIQFNNNGRNNVSLQMEILDALVDKYPGIKFSIHGRGKPYGMQDYWGKLESGQTIGNTSIMNWFQKISKGMSDDEETAQAEHYFSIGHGDYDEETGTEPTYIVWAYVDGHIEAGPLSHGEALIREDDSLMGSTHGTLWGHDVTDRTYKGRYEPETGRLTIVKPKHREMYQIPQFLMDALHEKFDFIKSVSVF